eukprot:4990863-Amphidinium_carterae.1
MVLVCAREIFWFGLAYKVDAAIALLAHSAVLLLRMSLAVSPSSLGTLLEDGAVGPPLPLSFVAALSSSVLAASKLFETVGEDLDEEGERWRKPSSRSLYDDANDQKRGRQ